ncbi:MAG: hypothetical protein QF475_03515 [Candidatus Undinarchaeales archaeon]|jgi:hypothetical protein|nr:hypothetical protein [Candidatus Undinarchaeales archaeon]
MKVNFVFSEIYEMMIRAAEKGVYLKDPKENPILLKSVLKDKELMEEFKTKIEQRWRVYTKLMMKSVEKVTGWKWWDNQDCYVVKEMNTVAGFSDPLTIRYMKDLDNAVGLLFHEMLHLLIAKNVPEDSEVVKLLEEKFESKTPIVQFHILPALIFRAVKNDMKFSEYFENIYEDNRKYMGRHRERTRWDDVFRRERGTGEWVDGAMEVVEKEIWKNIGEGDVAERLKWWLGE